MSRLTGVTALSSVTCRPNLPLPLKPPLSPEPNTLPSPCLSSGLSLCPRGMEDAVTAAGTGIPGFQKSILCRFAFTNIPTLIPVFTHWNPKRNFALLRKKTRSENSVQCALQWAIQETACAPSNKSGPAKLLPQELTLRSQQQAAIALSCVCELCYILIYFVHPLAR